ncbi:MAG TPA: hypothetical protein DIS66_03700 [Candidatus Omnitrophica bacterium]|nr:hypothetical protein [Candidatus Omnitrophota bacterium]
MYKKSIYFLTGLFCVMVLAGCSEDARIQKAIPKEADTLARDFMTAVEAKNSDAALQLIEPQVRKEASEKIKNIIQLFESAKAQQIKPVGIRAQKKGEERLIQVSYQLYYPDKAIISTLVILETPTARSIVSVRVDPVNQPLEKLYAFKLFGKSFFHYIVLLLWIAVPLFIAYTLWQCVISTVKWKWIWAVAIILAFFPIYLDWTSGRAFIRLFSVMIFGVSFVKQKYGPLVLSVGVPVGAIVFYFKYLFRKNKSVPSL